MEFFEAHHITKNFANHRALNDVSIKVKEKTIFGLLGPNGAGKTTLLRIINQITGPDEGELFFRGQKLQPDDIYRIGYLPEERGLYKKMKVGEQAMYLAQLKGLSKSEAQKRLQEWFEKFEIISWWNRKVEELSKGMQQKIQFIVTILHQPELLIFDEPFSGFDPINTNLLKEEILKLRENGATVIFSTHNMSSVEEICDDIALINKSQKILDGNVDNIRNQFKDNIFEVKMTNINQNDFANFNSGFSILDQKIDHDLFKFLVKIPATATPNDLINKLVKMGNIHGFNEILPTMNEIFIRSVNEDKNQS